MECLRKLMARDLLNIVDVWFAETLVRITGYDNKIAMFCSALAFRAPRLGNVCLDLSHIEKIDIEEIGSCTKKEAINALQNAPYVATHPEESQEKPLVLEGERLYLSRYYLLEKELARKILAILNDKKQQWDPSTIYQTVDKIVNTNKNVNKEDLKNALEILNYRNLLIITGGPGTGKSTLTGNIVAALLDIEPNLTKLYFVAPTGRAASQIRDTIYAQLISCGTPDNILEKIPISGMTIHKAIGIVPDFPFRAQYNEEHPIDADLMVVDEASMVDLITMTKLFAACPRECKVILIGDPDQLVSVEAGTVLADMCKANALKKVILELTKVYRYNQDIATLAQSVVKSDTKKVLEILQRKSESIFYNPCLDKNWMEKMFTEARQAYVSLHELVEKDKIKEAFECLGRFRVLTATRKGKCGCEFINQILISRLIPSGSEWYSGHPIMITENDPEIGLFNGDLGIQVHRGQRKYAVFAHKNKNVQGDTFPNVDLLEVSKARLPRYEDAYAITIHKSQGGQSDTVTIILPEAPSPILTKELFYTGITRARNAVHIYGHLDRIREAVTTPTYRVSGLSEALNM